MKTYKDLEVWQKSIELVVNIYKLTEDFPKEEMYGLSNQIRRATVSIPSNIAEGSGRDSNKEFLRFLYISRGSLEELNTQFVIAHKLELIDSKEKINNTSKEIEDIGKMLNGLINYRKTKER